MTKPLILWRIAPSSGSAHAFQKGVNVEAVSYCGSVTALRVHLVDELALTVRCAECLRRTGGET